MLLCVEDHLTARPAALHVQPVPIAPLSPHPPPARGGLSFSALWWLEPDLITGWTFTPADDSLYLYVVF